MRPTDVANPPRRSLDSSSPSPTGLSRRVTLAECRVGCPGLGRVFEFPIRAQICHYQPVPYHDVEGVFRTVPRTSLNRHPVASHADDYDF
jgi:hypothetical protein